MNELTLWASFAEGLASFFSPCTVPVLPVFLAYFSGSAGNDKKLSRTFVRTLLFTLGISFAIVLLAITAFAAGQFFRDYKGILQLTGGVIVILIALSEIGLFQIHTGWNPGKHTNRLLQDTAGMLKPFLLGFFYSFSFTPCVGPALSSIAVLSASDPKGYVCLAMYLAGFAIPFLFLGVFSEKMLEWLQKRKNILPVIQKAGAVLLLAVGVYLFYGGVTTYKGLLQPAVQPSESQGTVSAYDFEAVGYDGNRYRLSDFKGHPIVVNYFATWCGYCQEEIPSFIALGNEFPDVITVGILEITSESDEQIRKYMEEKQIPYTILLDPGCTIGNSWGVNGYPTTFFIDRNFDFLGYAPGYLDTSQLRQVYEQLTNGEG